MSGRKEKELRRALDVVKEMNAKGVTSRQHVALAIGTNELQRRALMAKTKIIAKHFAGGRE